ncbi:MAG: cyanophycinase, partial [Sediminibacterium sp.]
MRKIFIALFVFALLQNSATVIAQSSIAKGKLIIVGGGSMPDTMYQLFAKSIGGKDQSVVVIPTATNDSAINAGAHLTRFKKEGFTNLTTVHARSKDATDAPAFIKAIQNAKGIYFSGGDQSRIADAFLGTQVHAAMLALFKSGGVFMGTSAGATIMGTLLV